MMSRSGKGFYCVIQFRPNAFREEGVNVGVVVGDGARVCVMTARSNEHVKRVFHRQTYDDARLASAKAALARRIEQEVSNIDAMRAFISKEAGQLAVLDPRPAVVQDVDLECGRFFVDLVTDPPRRKRRSARLPELQLYFLPVLPRLESDVTVRIPLIEEPVRMDYVFSNGARNFIKGVAFGPEPSDQAQHWGSHGLLLRKHPEGPMEQRLIVVGKLPETAVAVVARILEDHQVDFYPLQRVEALVKRVKDEAH